MFTNSMQIQTSPSRWREEYMQTMNIWKIWKTNSTICTVSWSMSRMNTTMNITEFNRWDRIYPIYKSSMIIWVTIHIPISKTMTSFTLDETSLGSRTSIWRSSCSKCKRKYWSLSRNSWKSKRSWSSKSEKRMMTIINNSSSNSIVSKNRKTARKIIWDSWKNRKMK